jgi:hypothetical protein
VGAMEAVDSVDEGRLLFGEIKVVFTGALFSGEGVILRRWSWEGAESLGVKITASITGDKVTQGASFQIGSFLYSTRRYCWWECTIGLL